MNDMGILGDIKDHIPMMKPSKKNNSDDTKGEDEQRDREYEREREEEGTDGDRVHWNQQLMSLLLPSGNLTELLKITIFNGKIHYFYGHFQ